MKELVEKIGTPAALEQLAEECAELQHATLKMARKMRGENPTPAPLELISANFNEEIADVMVCIDTLIQAGVADNEEIANWVEHKGGRWIERVEKAKSNAKTDDFRMIKPKKAVSCPRCQGSGMIPAPGPVPWVMKPCTKCNGTGEVEDNE
jgi:uncharacterized protein (DUF1800 family)